ncbi:MULTISPECIES: hypothetical protein [unclassified Streptomyces]|uniref:hypothetical protein n=1 Tax=unclassified Streptomyces TaxID=2593676 RepID=UPI0004C0B1A6|nr:MULTISPECIES: hypothetical protein [unclassified Streptomyces]
MFRSQYADVPVPGLPPHEAVPGRAAGSGDARNGTAAMRYDAERVAPYPRVRRVAFADRVPRAVSGTIRRREPRERP